MKYHHQDTTAISEEANRKFLSYTLMSQKTSERKCPFCENIIHGSHLSKHLEEVHKDSRIGASVYPFKCDLCTYSTKRKHDLRRHIQQKHSSHEDQDRQLLIKSLIVLEKLDLSDFVVKFLYSF